MAAEKRSEPRSAQQDQKLSSPHPGEKEPQSAKLLNLVPPPRRPLLHEQLQDLSLSTIYCLLAALMQCLSLACLCTAISLLKWVLVLQPTNHYPRVYVSYTFGMPYQMVVYRSPNSNETVGGKTYFFNKEENDVMSVMITLCVLGLGFGFVAFLLDFVEIKRLGQKQMALTCFLHIFSGIFIVTLLILCCWSFLKIKKCISEAKWKSFSLTVALGESFYVILICLGLIALAVIFSFRSMKNS